MEGWSEFKQKETSGSKIANMLDKGHSALVMENRKYMKAVVESLRFTACQGIAHRGHREGEESHNLGNFHELLHVIAKFDPAVDKKLATNPSNDKYTHHDIQNEIFAVMAEMIMISDEVRDAECFVLHLIMFEELFRTTKFMSDWLQAPNFDLVAAEDLADDMKTHSFYPVIDRLMVEMNLCFSTETNYVLRGVPTLSPKHIVFGQTTSAAHGPTLWCQLG